jgi:hypothetical protein
MSTKDFWQFARGDGSETMSPLEIKQRQMLTDEDLWWAS